jgi:hypothetical protein
MKRKGGTKAPGHDVSFSVPPRPLGRVDISFVVRRRGRLFGELLISKGALVWLPYQKQYGYKLWWTQFPDVAVNRGRRGPGK